MSKEIVRSIELNIADVTVKVTPKQAKALFDALSELLGKPEPNQPIYWRPYPYWGTYYYGNVGTGGIAYTNGVMPLTSGTVNLNSVSSSTSAGFNGTMESASGSTVTFKDDVPMTLTIQ